MNNFVKIFIVLIAFLGGYLLFLNIGEAPTNKDYINKVYTADESKIIAENWVKTKSPTYIYDGFDLSFKEEKLLDLIECENCYEFDFSFKSKHGDFGNREGKMVTQVITPHIITVTIENGEVTQAMTDNKFNEMREKISQEKQRTDMFRPQEVSIYYYNIKADTDEDKNVACSADSVQPVDRIVEGDGVIKESIKTLLDGKLSAVEIEKGFQTEFPNPDFDLVDMNLKNGILTLEFTEAPSFASVGSCRVGLLKAQIEKTVMQFSEVDEVVIKPETLFQP